MMVFSRFSRCVFVAFLAASIFCSCSETDVSTGANFDMVELPDGSVVYLNHNSSLRFDEDFESRNVRADGELFFSVARGDTPFVVETTGGTVKVFGTEFGVRGTDDEVEVEVEEGVVELHAGSGVQKVRRGQAARFKSGDKLIHKVRAEFRFRAWLNALKVEFKAAGREFKRGTKIVGKESKKAGKELKKELKSLKP